MSELPIKATLKAGQGYDAPWLTVDASDPVDLKTKLDGLGSSAAFESLVNAANLLKGANNAAPLLQGGEQAQPAPQQAPAQPVQQSPWGGQQPAQQAASQPQGGFSGGPQNGQPHPEGISCPACGSAVLYKEFTSKAGKDFKLWACPQQRSKGDGHYSKFI